MQYLLVLLLLAGVANAQTPDLKTILDGNEASFKAIENISYNYQLKRDGPRAAQPEDVVSGRYLEVDPHNRVCEVNTAALEGPVGHPAVTLFREHQHTVLNDQLIATWMEGGAISPAMIYDFDDPMRSRTTHTPSVLLV